MWGKLGLTVSRGTHYDESLVAACYQELPGSPDRTIKQHGLGKVKFLKVLGIEAGGHNKSPPESLSQ